VVVTNPLQIGHVILRMRNGQYAITLMILLVRLWTS